MSQESKVEGGVQNQPCPPLSSSTPPMTSTHAMGRRGPHSGSDTRVHFSQTCDDDTPQLITHVETTPAPRSSEGVLSAIHTDLVSKDLLPGQHLVDAGYVTIANLEKSQSSYGVDLLGPTLETRLLSSGDRLRSHSLLYRLGSGDSHLSVIGRISSSWTPVQDAGKSLIKVKFSPSAIVKSVPLRPPARERLGAV